MPVGHGTQHPPCSETAAAIAAVRASHSRVDPSISLNKNVTVPAGAPRTTLITPAWRQRGSSIVPLFRRRHAITASIITFSTPSRPRHFGPYRSEQFGPRTPAVRHWRRRDPTGQYVRGRRVVARCRSRDAFVVAASDRRRICSYPNRRTRKSVRRRGPLGPMTFTAPARRTHPPSYRSGCNSQLSRLRSPRPRRDHACTPTVGRQGTSSLQSSRGDLDRARQG